MFPNRFDQDQKAVWYLCSDDTWAAEHRVGGVLPSPIIKTTFKESSQSDHLLTRAFLSQWDTRGKVRLLKRRKRYVPIQV